MWPYYLMLLKMISAMASFVTSIIFSYVSFFLVKTKLSSSLISFMPRHMSKGVYPNMSGRIGTSNETPYLCSSSPVIRILCFCLATSKSSIAL